MPTTPCRRVVWSFVGMLGAFALAATPARAQDHREPLRLAVSTGLNGELASLACTVGVGGPSPFASIASALAAEPHALAIDSGNLVGTGATGRMAVDRDPEWVAQALVATGLRVLAVGHNDLGMPRATFRSLSRALAAQGVPYVLSNLACDAAARSVCEAIVNAGDPPRLLDTPAGRVAVVAAMAPAWLQSIARERTAGLTLQDPAVALARAVRRARAAGADRVVATFDPTPGAALTDALTLADALPPDAQPDVLLVNHIAEHVGTVVSARGVRIVATQPARVVVVVPGSAAPVRPAGAATVPERISRFAVEITDWLCRTLNEPLPGGALEAPLEPQGFADLLLDVLREQTRADVAVINRGAIESGRPFPLRGTITRLDVTLAMPFENGVRVARVRGSVLRALVTSERAGRFFFRGVEVVDGAVKVNGRALDNDRDYQVVTTEFVAEGGDGGFDADDVAFVPWGTESVRDVFLAWLARPRDDAVGTDTLDLASRTRWTLGWSLDGTVAAVMVSNPNPMLYNDTQLVRAQTLTLRGETELRADADHPAYTFDNSVRLRYGLVRTISPSGMDSGFTENADLIVARSTGTYREIRGRQAVWYLPLPYGEMYTESEFSCPCPADPMVTGRRYHHLQMRPTLGTRFEFSERFYVYGGAGVDWEVYQPARSIAPVFLAGWTLRPGAIFSVAGRSADGESSLELSWRDPFGEANALVRFRVKLSIPLLDAVALTLSYDLFGRYSAGQGAWAVAGDANIGLKIALTRALQAFSF